MTKDWFTEFGKDLEKRIGKIWNDIREGNGKVPTAEILERKR